MVKPEEDAGVLQPSEMKDDWWFQHTKSLKLTSSICLLVFVFRPNLFLQGCQNSNKERFQQVKSLLYIWNF